MFYSIYPGIHSASENKCNVKSLKEYRESKGKEWKTRVTKDPKSGGSGKKRADNDVIVNIGLMEWNDKEQTLKRKRGKKLVLRVPPTMSYWPLLKEAEEKWKNYHSNLYQPNQTYSLLFEDGRVAVLLPGSTDESFTLRRYREEIGKDYKSITLFLCTDSDFCKSDPDFGGTSCSKPTSTSSSLSSIKQESPEEDYKPAVKHPRCEGPIFDRIDLTKELASQALEQFEADEELACELQRRFEEESSLPGELNGKENSELITDTYSVISEISQAVDRSEQSFIVIRRGAPLQRTLSIWKRETNKNPSFLNRLLRVHFSGEQGIDSGAMAKEFYTKTLPDIGLNMFPNGSPVDSTSNIGNGSFISCGEIVATSLAQGGPAPHFLDENVFNLMANPDIDMKELDPDQHLTPADRSFLASIRNDVSSHQESIIDHGYTAIIDEAHVDEIVKSVIISIIMKRVVYLKEFMKGLAAFGLANLIKTYPEACKSLFVTKSQNDVIDANYLFSILSPEYSPEGSSKRCTEEVIMDLFQDFLFKLEDEQNISGYVEAIACHDVVASQEAVEQFNQPDLTPAGVMGWLTGQQHKPLNGEAFTISVLFNHECTIEYPNHTICFPVVGACAKAITLPVVHMKTSAEFNEIFLLAYCKGQSFANA